MKKTINLLLVGALIATLTSCGSSSQKIATINFEEKMRPVATSLDTITAFVVDSAIAFPYDPSSLADGFDTRPVHVMLFVKEGWRDHKKFMGYNYSTNESLGPFGMKNWAQGAFDTAILCNHQIGATNRKTGVKTILGGENRVIQLDNLLLFFDSEKQAQKTLATLQTWEASIRAEGESKPVAQVGN